MLDEEYHRDQIADYGTFAQPAIAARMKPAMRKAQLGDLFSVVSVVATVAGLVLYPVFAGSDGQSWAVAALICSVLMLAVTTFQHLAWWRAMVEFTGAKDIDLESWRKASWLVHLVSYLVVAAGIWTYLAALVQSSPEATAYWLLVLGLLTLVVAQVLGGVQYVRVSGPPGTVSNHIRQLIDRQDQRAR